VSNVIALLKETLKRARFAHSSSELMRPPDNRMRASWEGNSNRTSHRRSGRGRTLERGPDEQPKKIAQKNCCSTVKNSQHKRIEHRAVENAQRVCLPRYIRSTPNKKKHQCGKTSGSSFHTPPLAHTADVDTLVDQPPSTSRPVGTTNHHHHQTLQLTHHHGCPKPSFLSSLHACALNPGTGRAASAETSTVGGVAELSTRCQPS
jgi:hypothetical protein